MSFQDWNEIKWDKRGEKNANESKTEYLNKQIRNGNITQKLKPVSANQTITIALKPFYNPTGEGIYLFRVHVISSGEKTNNLVVGTARLQFYNDFDDHLFYEW